MADYTIRIVVEGVDRASGPLGGVAGALGRIGEFGAGGVLASAVTGTFRAIGGGATAAIGGLVGMTTASAELSSQIATIGAVGGLTTEEIGQVSAKIDELGINPNLKVSATEAADAIEMLSRNGMAMGDILAGGAEKTVLLANATGADFSTSADIATDMMAVFGMGAADMGGAVDFLAGAVNKSKFGIEDFGGALAQGGGVAAVAGVEYEDFITVIAGSSPLFASGTDAGTSFKTMMQRMQPQSKEAARLMGELGLLTEDGTSAFYDATGSLKDMDEIVGLLNDSFGDLTEAQRTEALGTIFGTDAMRMAAALAGMTREEFNALQNQIGEVSSLEMASTRVNNLAGDLDILSGAVETTKIQIGRGLEPIGRAWAQALTPVVGDLAPKLAEISALVGAGIAAMTPDIKAINDAWVMPALDGVIVNMQNLTANAPAAVQAYADLGGGLLGLKAAVDLLAADDSVFQKVSDMFSAEEATALDTYGVSASGFFTMITSGMAGVTTSFDKESKEFTADFGNWAASWNDKNLTKLAIGDLIDLDFESQKPALQQFADQIAPAFENMLMDKIGLSVDFSEETPLPWGLELPVTPVVGEPDVEFLANWQLPVTAVVESVTVTGGASGFGLAVPAEPVWTMTPPPWEPLAVQMEPVWTMAPLQGEPFQVPAEPVWTMAPLQGEPMEVPATPVWTMTPPPWEPLGLQAKPVEAEAQISAVVWGEFTNIYDVDASVASDPDWGVFSTIYDVLAAVVSEPDWGNYTHEYPATVRVIEVKEGGGSTSSGGFGTTGRAVGGRATGGLMMVGEFGPELVRLPRGSDVMTAGETRRAGGAAAPVNVTVNAAVSSEIDVRSLAWRVADELRRMR